MAFRVLGAGNLPSHRTLCGFRRRHLEDFRGLFVEVVRGACGMGLARFGKLSVDGTKVRTNASQRKATGYGRMLRRERGWRRGSGRCRTGRATPMRVRTNASGRRSGATNCRRSCAAAGTGWRRPGRRRRIWRRSSAGRTMRAGGSAIPRAGGPTSVPAGAGREGAEQPHRPRRRHHGDKLGGVPTVLQRTGDRGRRTPVDCRDGADLGRK